MKYMLLIHQGVTPTPGGLTSGSLSEDEKGAVYGAYKALNETPGVSPGLQLQPPETIIRAADHEQVGARASVEEQMFGVLAPSDAGVRPDTPLGRERLCALQRTLD